MSYCQIVPFREGIAQHGGPIFSNAWGQKEGTTV